MSSKMPIFFAALLAKPKIENWCQSCFGGVKRLRFLRELFKDEPQASALQSLSYKWGLSGLAAGGHASGLIEWMEEGGGTPLDQKEERSLLLRSVEGGESTLSLFLDMWISQGREVELHKKSLRNYLFVDAAWSFRLDSWRCLLSRGFSYSGESFLDIALSGDSMWRKRTPLHLVLEAIAAHEGEISPETLCGVGGHPNSLEIAQALIQKGAPLSSEAVESAASFSDLRLLRYLISQGCPFDMEATFKAAFADDTRPDSGLRVARWLWNFSQLQPSLEFQEIIIRSDRNHARFPRPWVLSIDEINGNDFGEGLSFLLEKKVVPEQDFLAQIGEFAPIETFKLVLLYHLN